MHLFLQHFLFWPSQKSYFKQIAGGLTSTVDVVEEIAGAAKNHYRFTITGVSGQVHYSPFVETTIKNTTKLKAFVSSNTLLISLPPKANTISLFDETGLLLLTKPVADSILKRFTIRQFEG